MREIEARPIPAGDMNDPGTRSDILFLAEWERDRPSNLGALLRAGQIRRANPALAEAMRHGRKPTL